MHSFPFRHAHSMPDIRQVSPSLSRGALLFQFVPAGVLRSVPPGVSSLSVQAGVPLSPSSNGSSCKSVFKVPLAPCDTTPLAQMSNKNGSLVVRHNVVPTAVPVPSSVLQSPSAFASSPVVSQPNKLNSPKTKSSVKEQTYSGALISHSVVPSSTVGSSPSPGPSPSPIAHHTRLAFTKKVIAASLKSGKPTTSQLTRIVDLSPPRFIHTNPFAPLATDLASSSPSKSSTLASGVAPQVNQVIVNADVHAEQDSSPRSRPLFHPSVLVRRAPLSSNPAGSPMVVRDHGSPVFQLSEFPPLQASAHVNNVECIVSSPAGSSSSDSSALVIDLDGDISLKGYPPV